MSRLNADEMNAACRDEGLPWVVEVAAEVTSTNDVLRDTGAAVGTVLFAEAQTRGRGRRDHVWLSPPGKDLTFSLVLETPPRQAEWPRITTLTALAMCRAIEAELPLRPGIKWPNDIFINDRKVGGILATAALSPGGTRIVVGIGLNVNNRQFPAELVGGATSLALEVASLFGELDRQSLALALLRELAEQHRLLGDGKFDEVLAGVRQRSLLLGRQIRAMVDGMEVYGRAVDLDGEGGLIITLADGTRRQLTSAEGVRKVL